MDYIDDVKLNNNNDKVDEYMRRLNEIKKNEEARVKLEKYPIVSSKAIDRACHKCKITSLDKMLGKIYNDAIPVEGNNVVDVDKDISDFIATKTHGKDTEYYIKEAIRKNNSPFLTKMCEGAESMAKKHRERKEDMIKNDPSISLTDLENYRFDKTESDNLRTITSDMGFDEVSDIIRQNVKNTIQDEFDRTENEQKEIQALEDELASNEDITDSETMESAISKELSKRNINPEIHQPSLFEGILQYYTESFGGQSNDDILYRSICDYTMLSTMKALRLESNLNNRLALTNLAKTYKRR